MKRIIYFCGLLFLCVNGLAQVDPNDRNWKCVLNDDFSVNGRTWNKWTFDSSDGLWRAYPGIGVTNGENEHQVYQFGQCHFNDAKNVLELVCKYDDEGKIKRNDYFLPGWMWESRGGKGYPCGDSLYYFSGEIDHIKATEDSPDGRFRYGYFEIECELPIHRGAFPAFWLWHANKKPSEAFYEEIDIFEFSWAFEEPVSWSKNLHPHGAGNPYCFTTGIYFNDTCYDFTRFARNYPMINETLDHRHTFGCEWMPDHVRWFCDDKLVNEFLDSEHIPHRPLTLKTNYAIDRYALRGFANDALPRWIEGDTMTIHRISVYQLKWDCGTDETITSQTEFDRFQYAVKNSIEIAPTKKGIVMHDTAKATFRVADSFAITGPFQVDQGGELTIIVQACKPDDDN